MVINLIFSMVLAYPSNTATNYRMPSIFTTLSNRLLDASVLYSFDQSGYHRHAKSFNTADLDVDMSGKVVLITGANSGLGKASALAIASKNATVYLLCRNPQRGEQARLDIIQKTQNPNVHLKIIDLSDLLSIQRFSASFPERQIDVLIHNAGVLPLQLQTSPQGLEMTYATNIVGPQLLTFCLWDRLEHGRMILVSSGGMYPVKLNNTELRQPPSPFNGVTAYAQTKRAQVILTELWARKGEAQNIRVHSMHPGWADTPGVEHSLPLFWNRMQNRLRTPQQGADTIVWLALSKKAGQSSGQFWFDRKIRATHLFPTKERAADRKMLWEMIEEDINKSLPHFKSNLS